ncbi:MAG: hypothetical protein HY318_02875 [Armatimonadetes bacterium]|nr:hypothetical protein [Armatimonadota bacterium]
MSSQAETFIHAFLNELQSRLEPMEGNIEYGNLRKQVSDWEDEKGKITNLAVIYETPGGSTNQINVSIHHAPPSFWLLNEAASTEEEIQDPSEVLDRLEKQANAIPEKRRTRLRSDIETWCSNGRTQAEIFTALKDLLHTEFRGARITQEELNEATRFTIEMMRSLRFQPDGSAGEESA